MCGNALVKGGGGSEWPSSNWSKKVDIKFQQILKYETGMNWVSASHLWDISEVMDVPVGSLFGGLKPADSDKSLYNDLLGDKKHWIWYGFIRPCQKVNADGCLI